MARSYSRAGVFVGALLACALATGCAATGPRLGGKPANLRVVILPTSSAVEGAFEGFSEQLAADLENYGAAVDVTAANEGSITYERADLRVRPRLSSLDVEPTVVEEEGYAWVGSYFYWAFTWVGGLAVRDYVYDYVDVSFDIRASEGAPPIDSAPRIGEYSVALHERANGWLWCVPCILYPPRWVPDDEERLRKSLDAAVRRRAAEELTSFLKHEFETLALTKGEGSMELSASTDGSHLYLKGRVASRQRPIGSVVVVVDGVAVSLAADPAESGWHDEVFDYVVADNTSVELPVGMVPATVTIRATADREFSRTLRVEQQ